jgi:3-phenylpropionate/cinnamic acid dioxygenase small subunit
MNTEVQHQITPELQYQISRLLYQEAYLLDHRKYKEWLELLTDDLIYRMPLRETVEGGIEVENIVDEMAFLKKRKNP